MFLNDIGKMCFGRPVYLSGKSAWAEHIPFAFTLIEKVKPKIFVELGTHYGDSYCAFCQAIQKTELDCQAYAVDTWQGDEHAGHYGQDVLNQLRARHDVPYSSFSRLLRETFDDAAQHFAPKSVDLLHIDGLHSYEAVKNDWDTWLPLLSDKAIVIFHDVNVRENGFGVWKLFEEIEVNYPTFRFDHAHGLGVVAAGKDVPDELKFLFELSDTDKVSIREFYKELGFAVVNERKLVDALHIQNHNVEQSAQEKAQLSDQLAEQKSLTDEQESVSDDLRNKIAELDCELQSRNQELQARNHELHAILNSKSWRAVAIVHKKVRQARKLRTLARKVVAAKNKVGGWRNFCTRIQRILKSGGIRALKEAARAQLKSPEAERGATRDILKDRQDSRFKEIESRFLMQSNESFDFGIKISLIMPVYKVPDDLLKAAIESVIGQSYINWELCIADDCSQSPSLNSLLESYVQRDKRIKYVQLEKNSGIAAASNQALSLATGAYIALLDNDDVLTNDALFWIASTIKADPALDMLYSDECKIDEKGTVQEIFNKPDWSPSLLLNCMYTGHLSAYRKALVDEVGGFRSEFDFSQDYDLALRITERTDKIYHIEEVLYGWRAIASSGAAGGKPYARESNIRALQAAGDRRGWKGTALALPAANRFKFALDDASDLVSIVIPSDNEKNISDSLESIGKSTTWSNYEILVVTNSSVCDALEPRYPSEHIKFVRYDLPYSFSDKCNQGAKAAIGKFLVFFNDDVRVQTSEWVETLVEVLELPGVGIAGPKLVYESNTIQHAGMVTGVRRLLGTAFHCLPEDTNAHYNFAQSVREVSLICGACLAIRKDVFEQIDGFDAVNAPINHSDVDLCFKVRELGYSCVYTPHSTLTHIGHMSLASVDAIEKVSAPKKKDKADIYILRRWANYLGRDPFYTKAMREQLFHDSPDYYEVFSNETLQCVGGKDILLFSHDLSESGAPRIVYELAKLLTNAGHFVVVMSPTDGSIRKDLQDLGVTVVVDELLLTQHASVFDFARNFDALICNTVMTYPVVNQLSDVVDVYWYIHEISLLAQLAASDPDFVRALKKPKKIWAGSKLAAIPVMKHNQSVQVLEYGFPSLLPPLSDIKEKSSREKLVVRTFGSYEPRKGQDLLALAIAALPAEIANKCKFEFYGRVLDESFFQGLTNTSKKIPNLELFGDIGYKQYVELMFSTDLLIVPSRDDTLPLVSLHALSAGKPVMCTLATGTSAYLKHKQSGFIIPGSSAAEMTKALVEAITLSADWPVMGDSAKQLFDKCFSEQEFSKKLMYQLGF
ncbi:glycosyltransferase [Pseudomonas sp. TNT2022 ID642]|uniref:glycosyltransferase n=1 Tax=Pseudomonas sp. TNT2022 ID642 TaxID=2942632 RepID=UPI00235F838A|nr:glycosyltransferase [Pseudomonas sp. TNT2022 ID642]MDD1005304.1 glycosyltransferase [Pseudomonas sp. TNT2022 ID642]